jgi:hypothetical protein
MEKGHLGDPRWNAADTPALRDAAEPEASPVPKYYKLPKNGARYC